MKKTISTLTIALAFTLLATVEAQAKPKVESIQGFMYYFERGTWSKNVIDKDFEIFNPSIGEGSLESPAKDTLFVVKVSGLTYELLHVVVEHVDGKGKKKKVHDARHQLETGTNHVPVMVYETTYGSYIITATVEDAKKKKLTKPHRVKVAYNGGE